MTRNTHALIRAFPGDDSERCVWCGERYPDIAQPCPERNRMGSRP